MVVNSGALSGAFSVLVFCRWWSNLVLFLVLFWCSCFVDGGQFWRSSWCFLGARGRNRGGGVGRRGQALV